MRSVLPSGNSQLRLLQVFDVVREDECDGPLDLVGIFGAAPCLAYQVGDRLPRHVRVSRIGGEVRLVRHGVFRQVDHINSNVGVVPAGKLYVLVNLAFPHAAGFRLELKEQESGLADGGEVGPPVFLVFGALLVQAEFPYEARRFIPVRGAECSVVEGFEEPEAPDDDDDESD